MSTLPLFDATPLTPIQRRDAAMEQVGRHADQISDRWRERCYELLIHFAGERKLYSRPFITEEFVEYAKDLGMEMPHDYRAFGGVVNRAAREGKLTRVGYRTDKFASPKSLWEAV